MLPCLPVGDPSLTIGPTVNSGLMEGNTVALRYPLLRLWGTGKKKDRSRLFPLHRLTLFRPLGNSAVLHNGGETASLSLLIQLLTYVLFTRLVIIFITIIFNLLK